MNLMTCKGLICLRSYNTDRYSSLIHQSRKYLSTDNLTSRFYISLNIWRGEKIAQLETGSNFNFHPSIDLEPDNAEESSKI